MSNAKPEPAASPPGEGLAKERVAQIVAEFNAVAGRDGREAAIESIAVALERSEQAEAEATRRLRRVEAYAQHQPVCELARSQLYKDGEPRQTTWRAARCTCGLAAALTASPPGAQP